MKMCSFTYTTYTMYLTLHSFRLNLYIAVQMYKYLNLPVHLHLEVNLVAWPMELLLTHHLQTVSVHPC